MSSSESTSLVNGGVSAAQTATATSADYTIMGVDSIKEDKDLSLEIVEAHVIGLCIFVAMCVSAYIYVYKYIRTDIEGAKYDENEEKEQHEGDTMAILEEYVKDTSKIKKRWDVPLYEERKLHVLRLVSGMGGVMGAIVHILYASFVYRNNGAVDPNGKWSDMHGNDKFNYIVYLILTALAWGIPGVLQMVYFENTTKRGLFWFSHSVVVCWLSILVAWVWWYPFGGQLSSDVSKEERYLWVGIFVSEVLTGFAATAYVVMFSQKPTLHYEETQRAVLEKMTKMQKVGNKFKKAIGKLNSLV